MRNLFDVDRSAAIVLLLLVTLVSAHTLKYPFSFIDDYSLVVNNPHLDLPFSALPTLFVKPFLKIGNSDAVNYTVDYYRPLVGVVTCLDYKLWGINPVGFHLVNLMFHFLSAFMVYRLGLIVLNKDIILALVAASLFAVHPVHNEPISRILSNENMLGFFVLSSICFFLRGRRVLSLVAFGLALFTKESALMLVLLLGILAVQEDGLKKGVRTLYPFAFVSAGYLLLRALAVGLPSTGSNLFALSKILAMAVALKEYLRLLIVPWPLKAFYPSRTFSDVLQPEIAIAFIALTLYLFLVWKVRRDKVLFFLTSAILIMLVPAILKTNNFGLGWDTLFIAERQLYIPVMFYTLAVCSVVAHRTGDQGRKIAVAGLATLVLLFGSATVTANRMWESDTTVYDQLLKECPDFGISHRYLGEMLYSQGKYDDAFREITAAFRSSRSSSESMELSQGGQSRIISSGRQNNAPDWNDLRIYHPIFASLHFRMGCIYLEKHETDRAISKFNTALRLQPHFVEARSLLAKLYLDTGKLDKARVEYGTILRDFSTENIYRP